MRVQAHSVLCWSVVVLWLGGCSWLNDDKGLFVDPRDDYLYAKEGRALDVPENLAKDAVQDPFPIPPTPGQSNANYYPNKPPLPDAIYGDDKAEEVRIQRIGDRQWLVVPEDATTLWPKLKQFFAENGVAIANEQPGDGRIDTAALSIADEGYRDLVRKVLQAAKSSSSPTSERVMLRVERGLRENTSEVHLRHLREGEGAGDDDTGVGSLDLAPNYVADLRLVTSSDTQAEADLLKEIGGYIAAHVSEQMVSMIATSISTEAKSVMERDSKGAPALRLNMDRERAWATIGQALDNAAIEVSDSDRTGGRYDILVTEQTFIGTEDKPGMFSRMFGGKVKGDAFQLLLLPASDAAADEAFWVVVRNADDQLPDRELAQQMLVLVREYAG